MAAPYASSAMAGLPQRAANFGAPVPVSNAPPGTFAPGTKVQVGSHRVIIEKYLSEGGFAHVYVVRVPKEGNKHEIAVLKRVAVPDKEALANMRTEVETMKKLKGHKHIVTYIDSHASQMKGGGYEVFLLMEFCAGGGLIDFMNTRLQHRLTEPEILKIFGDVSEGVATMHYLRPPLLHRDLKVENVLISKPPTSSSGVAYKLCDFGSAAPPRPAATNAAEGRLIEDDVQRHTTMQYRSPEMVDVWRKQPIDEKSDIWALGVLLYKLCYYTTPFEAVGQMAILNASFKYPHYPPFSDRLKRLIGSMLKEDPKQRPNIYQVIKEVCSMRGTPVPIKDIYANRTQSEARKNEHLPSPVPSVASPPPAGIHHAPPVKQVQAIPDIAPMRRGRPTAPAQQAPVSKSSANPSPARGDPFAALDSASYQVRVGAVDELSARFPSLDEFSIAVDKGGDFKFAPSARTEQTDLNTRTTHALADKVFAQPKPAQPTTSEVQRKAASQLRPTKVQSDDSSSRRSESSKDNNLLHQPTAVRPGYASTGTMTSPSPPVTLPKLPEIKHRAIWRVPDHNRSSSQPRASPSSQSAANSLKPKNPQRPSFLDTNRSKSQSSTVTLRSPASSRPSLEGHRPSDMDMNDNLTRAKSANSKARPVSAAYVESNLDFLRDQERESASKKRPSLDIRRPSRQPSGENEVAIDDTNIESDTDYLRSVEGGQSAGWSSSRKSSDHKKRTSLPSLGLSGTKVFGSKLGDAFRRFESGGSDKKDKRPDQPLRTPSPQPPGQTEKALLSPISGSEATASPPGNRGSMTADLAETEDLPPEVRRELERRRLEQEERRVAEAAAEHRNRTANGQTVPNRASTIQKRVQSLLDEGRQSPAPRRTAEGYGHYTDNPHPQQQLPLAVSNKGPPPMVARKPVVAAPAANMAYSKPRQQQPMNPPIASIPIPSASAPPAHPRPASRPSAPPKPMALRTGTPVQDISYPQPPTASREATSAGDNAPASGPRSRGAGPGLAALLARDAEGVAAPGGGHTQDPSADIRTADSVPTDAVGVQEDWEADFSKRYPSLSGIEMVETEIVANAGGGGGPGGRRMLRVKDV